MKALVAGIALVTALTGAGLLWAYRIIQAPLSLPDSPVVLEVKSGQSLKSLLLELEADGFLHRPHVLALWARWQGLDRQIQAGEYELHPGLTGASFLNLLASGAVLSYRITLPEGITLSDALARLHKDGRLAREIQHVDDPRLLDLVAPHESAEGWFLPETYQYVTGDTDLDILRSYCRYLVESKLIQKTSVIGAVAVMESVEDAVWLRENRPNVMLPDDVLERLETAADPRQEGILICSETLRAMSEIPGLVGAKVMAPRDLTTIPAVIRASGLHD